MNIKVKRIDYPQEWDLPHRAHEGDVGYDLRNAGPDTAIGPREKVLINTGLAFELPNTIEGQIRSRSGLALDKMVVVLHGLGTVDSGYRDVWKVPLLNLSDRKVHISHGERVAQVVFNKVETPDLVEVEELSETTRGLGGFGSTGRI